MCTLTQVTEVHKLNFCAPIQHVLPPVKIWSDVFSVSIVICFCNSWPVNILPCLGCVEVRFVHVVGSAWNFGLFSHQDWCTCVGTTSPLWAVCYFPTSREHPGVAGRSFYLPPPFPNMATKIMPWSLSFLTTSHSHLQWTSGRLQQESGPHGLLICAVSKVSLSLPSF